MAHHLRLDIAHPALYPEVAETLRRLPLAVLFHSRYPYRHPAAIYQLSIRQLSGDFRRLLADYALARSRTVTLAAIDEQMTQSQRTLTANDGLRHPVAALASTLRPVPQPRHARSTTEQRQCIGPVSPPGVFF